MKSPKIKDVVDNYKLDVTHRELTLIRAALQSIDTKGYDLDKVNSSLFDCAEFGSLQEVKDEIKHMVKMMGILDHICHIRIRV